jgi:hypothetical protein
MSSDRTADKASAAAAMRAGAVAHGPRQSRRDVMDDLLARSRAARAKLCPRRYKQNMP